MVAVATDDKPPLPQTPDALYPVVYDELKRIALGDRAPEALARSKA